MKREIIKSTNIRINHLGGGDCGWDVCWGQEAVYRFLLPAVQAGDRVLDLFSGSGRVSIPLILKGAKLTLVDRNPEANRYARGVIRDSKINGGLEKIIKTNALKIDPRKTGLFKFVIAADAVTHLKKPVAIEFISRLPLFLQSGLSYVYVNVPSRSSLSYQMSREDSDNQIDVDTYGEWCDCSGEYKEEPIPYFTPGEAESVLINHGGKILCNREVEVSCGNFSREIIARFSK